MRLAGSSSRCWQDNEKERTKPSQIKSAIKQSKPALSPIKEETDSPDSSGDSAVNYHDIASTSKKYPHDLGLGLQSDYEADPTPISSDEEETLRDNKRITRDRSWQEFLTAGNSSNCEYSNNRMKNSDDETIRELTNFELNEFEINEATGRADDDDDDDDYDDLSLRCEKAFSDVYSSDYCRGIADERDRPKSAPLPSAHLGKTSEKFQEIATSLAWLKMRVVRSERDIFQLRNKLKIEKSRCEKLETRYEEEKYVTRESLRIDLELWIRKLNNGLKEYLGEWQKRERLRINEEISRISDLYSQEIGKSLKIMVKNWQAEEKRNIFEIIEKREQFREDNERTNAQKLNEKIQVHLENLEKRNKKSYTALCKQIDRWEEKLREEIVKLHEEDLKRLQQQVYIWYEDEGRKSDDSNHSREKISSERFTESNKSGSFLGSETLLQVEQHLFKRLRESSAKDFRRIEQIVRRELKLHRRELARRINEKIFESSKTFGTLGSSPRSRDESYLGNRSNASLL